MSVMDASRVSRGRVCAPRSIESIQLRGRKQKHQRSPCPQPPVKLIMLTLPGLSPFVAVQTGLLHFALGDGSWIDKMLQVRVLLPANAAQLRRHRLGVFVPIIVAREFDRSAVEINADWLGPPPVRLQEVEKMFLLDFKRTGKAGRQPKGFRMFPRQRQAANAPK